MTITTLEGLGVDAANEVISDYAQYIGKFPSMRKRILTGEGDNVALTDEWGDIMAILTLDVCYYVVRRLPYVCGSVSDTVRATRRKLVNEYELIYGPYSDPNNEVDY